MSLKFPTGVGYGFGTDALHDALFEEAFTVIPSQDLAISLE